MAKKRKIDDDNFYLGFSIHSKILNQDLKVVKKIVQSDQDFVTTVQS